MPRFTTRIELHKKENKSITKQDYDMLHEEMLKEKFSRIIEGDNGKRFHMLEAEYNRVEDGITLEDVMTSSRRACDKTVVRSSNIGDYSILITEGTRKWYNLPQA
ncbi:MAG TPA: hypothetical protein VGM41_10595 [Chitinophagaceae bacterium]